MKKYADVILDLRKKGSGSLSIKNYLYENHRIKVSRGTIEKFYKQNNL
jgi:intein-encoded DNA endonuclease-like protein